MPYSCEMISPLGIRRYSSACLLSNDSDTTLNVEIQSDVAARHKERLYTTVSADVEHACGAPASHACAYVTQHVRAYFANIKSMVCSIRAPNTIVPAKIATVFSGAGNGHSSVPALEIVTCMPA